MTKNDEPIFRKRLVLDGKVSGYGDRYDTLEQLLKEAKQLGHLNERKYEEVDDRFKLKKKAYTHAANCRSDYFLFTNIAHYLASWGSVIFFFVFVFIVVTAIYTCFSFVFFSSCNFKWSQRSRATYISG